jgi:hypothetical protein
MMLPPVFNCYHRNKVVREIHTPMGTVKNKINI